MATRANGKRKTAKKTPTKASQAEVALIPQPNGKGALLAGGLPGNKGGTGRPRKAFKKFCRETVNGEPYQTALHRAATDDKHQEFIGAAKLVASFAASKPPKKVHHLHTSSARDRLADRLTRIIERN